MLEGAGEGGGWGETSPGRWRWCTALTVGGWGVRGGGSFYLTIRIFKSIKSKNFSTKLKKNVRGVLRYEQCYDGW